MSQVVLTSSVQGQIAQSVPWLISYWLKEREKVFPFLTGARDFSLLANAQTESGTHTASHSMGTRGSSPAVNRPGHDVNHMSSSRVKVQNEGSYTFICLQCINRENSASVLCKLYQMETAINHIFLLLSSQRRHVLLPVAAREISGKRASSQRWRKAAEFGIN